jgi:hypothetical protein
MALSKVEREKDEKIVEFGTAQRPYQDPRKIDKRQ